MTLTLRFTLVFLSLCMGAVRAATTITAGPPGQTSTTSVQANLPYQAYAVVRLNPTGDYTKRFAGKITNSGYALVVNIDNSDPLSQVCRWKNGVLVEVPGCFFTGGHPASCNNSGTILASSYIKGYGYGCPQYWLVDSQSPIALPCPLKHYSDGNWDYSVGYTYWDCYSGDFTQPEFIPMFLSDKGIVTGRATIYTWVAMGSKYQGNYGTNIDDVVWLPILGGGLENVGDVRVSAMDPAPGVLHKYTKSGNEHCNIGFANNDGVMITDYKVYNGGTELPARIEYGVLSTNSRFRDLYGMSDGLTPRAFGYSSTTSTPFWCQGDQDHDLSFLKVGMINCINNAYDMVGVGLDGLPCLLKLVKLPNLALADQTNYVKAGLKVPANWSELSPAYMNDHGVLCGTATEQVLDAKDKPSGAPHPSQPVLLVPAELAVDANRDGIITLASDLNADPKLSDQTTQSKPFRFWSNDDNDSGSVDTCDIPGSTTPDGQQVKVQGIRDLIDYFPVFLDIKQLLTVLPAGANNITYKLKQADSGVRFVYTDLKRADAFKYLKDFATADSLKEADAHWATATGYALDAAWLGQVKDGDKGVILVEGRNATDKPLVLSVEKDGTVIAEVSLNIKISPVETMFRHLNLHDRGLAGLSGTIGNDGGVALSQSMGDPVGFPDKPNSDSSWLIFVHGFNVSGPGGRGWNAEMFKRTYWSGNKSRFVGVSWYGNPDDALGPLPADYHLSVRNAMVTAPVLAQEINALSGTKTIFAHSLGCGLISSAITDYGMNVSKACFVDAALARECYDGRNLNIIPSRNKETDWMIPAAWKPYDPKLYAANWFTRFAAETDARGKLTWNNRFSSASPVVYNFYSSTEDVLAEFEGEVPSWYPGIIADWASSGKGFGGAFGWVWQEKGKGDRHDYTGYHVGSYYGGWGMNLKDPLLSGDLPYWKWFSSPLPTSIGRIMKTSAEIGNVSDSVLRRHPVFEPGWGVVRNQEQQENPVSEIAPVDGAPSWILNLYGASTGNTTAAVALNRDQLLAEAIPALTWCLGSHTSTQLPSARNFDLPSLVDQTNWPRRYINSVREWRHSDMREVAYIYQCQLFDKIVTLSKPNP